LLGPAGAGLFRLASELADGAQKPSDLLARAFYPEVVRMDLSSKKPWKLMLRSSVLIGGVAVFAIVVLLIGGKPLIGLLFGKQFLGAYEPLMILMAVPLVGIFSFALVPMLYALGRSDGPLKAKLLGSLIFFLAIAPCSWTMGVPGAAIALVLGNITNVIAMMIQLRREHRRVRRPAGQAPTPDSARST
jgi:O-antigen/teichoic acid export membrane protein